VAVQAQERTGETSSNLTTLFIGARIDDDLYEELESALLVSDAGVEATQFLLDALKKKVKDEKLTEADQVRTALRTILIDLLKPLQKPLVLGRHQPLVAMICGVNGAGKTTTIGKLAKHLQAHKQSVLLAAGDTFRAAARDTDDLGRTQQHHRDCPGVGRSGRSRIRRRPFGAGARHQRGHGGYRRPPANAIASDG